MKEDSYKSIALSLVAFSLPLILSGVLQQLYSWADAFIVGNTEGSAALAAIGSTTAIINFFVNAITGFTLGLSILFAQRYGSGNRSDIRKLLSSFLVILGLVFLVLAVLGFIFTENILRLLDTTPDTFDKAYDYLRIIFIGIPFLGCVQCLCSGLKSSGEQPSSFLWCSNIIGFECHSRYHCCRVSRNERKRCCDCNDYLADCDDHLHRHIQQQKI